MKIELTREEAEDLGRLVYLGMWMLEAHENKEEHRLKKIEQVIYSKLAETAKDNSWIQQDELNHLYYPTHNFDQDEMVSTIIDDYEDNCFWDQLIDRLTKKEMVLQHGNEKIHKMTQSERFDQEKKYILQFENEFAKNGIDNLTLQK